MFVCLCVRDIESLCVCVFVILRVRGEERRGEFTLCCCQVPSLESEELMIPSVILLEINGPSFIS